MDPRLYSRSHGPPARPNGPMWVQITHFGNLWFRLLWDRRLRKYISLYWISYMIMVLATVNLSVKDWSKRIYYSNKSNGKIVVKFVYCSLQYSWADYKLQYTPHLVFLWDVTIINFENNLRELIISISWPINLWCSPLCAAWMTNYS